MLSWDTGLPEVLTSILSALYSLFVPALGLLEHTVSKSWNVRHTGEIRRNRLRVVQIYLLVDEVGILVKTGIVFINVLGCSLVSEAIQKRLGWEALTGKLL